MPQPWETAHGHKLVSLMCVCRVCRAACVVRVVSVVYLVGALVGGVDPAVGGDHVTGEGAAVLAAHVAALAGVQRRLIPSKK